MNVVGVLGLSKTRAESVSGYCRLDTLALERQTPYLDFENINGAEVEQAVQAWQPDLLFVVGLSQLVKPKLLSIPSRGCIGFHPTHLPEGRGRAPLAWLTYESKSGAASFFLMDEGTDSGPLLAQEPFEVSTKDYARDVEAKTVVAIDGALDHWLPKLKKGEWNPTPQDDSQATYYGKRSPEDGRIDWNHPAERILALIRASSHPHPGSYTFLEKEKLLVWRAEIESTGKFHGVPGRILAIDSDKKLLVQAGDRAIWVTEYEPPPSSSINSLRVGMKLGFDYEGEIHDLKKRITALEKALTKQTGQGKVRADESSSYSITP